MTRGTLAGSEIDAATREWIRCPADERAARNGCRFDRETGQFVVDWIQRYCRLYEGAWAGQKLIMKDWQLDCTLRMFGWLKWSERWQRWVRRFREASIWVAKKNSKSPTLAAWGLYLLCGDGEQGQKVFLGARDGQQARKIAGEHAIQMMKRSPELTSECRLNKTTARITHLPTTSFMEPLSSGDSRHQEGKEGINGSVLIDECFVGETLIATLEGSKRIDQVRPGNKIVCATGIGTVLGVSCRLANEQDLYEVEFSDGSAFTCTGNHRVFTRDGWVSASALVNGAITYGPEAMCGLWKTVRAVEETSGEWPGRSYAGDGLALPEDLLDILLEEVEEPDVFDGNHSQGQGTIEGDEAQASDPQGERAVNATASIGNAVCSRRRLGARFSGAGEEGSQQRLPNQLQTGSGESGIKNRHRVRWRIPSYVHRARTRREENRVPGESRVVRVSRLQRESTRLVFNLHVSKHPSYFANGHLVHNCHVVDEKFMRRVNRAGISRSEPFLIEVSTAGNNPDGYGKKRFDYARRVEAAEPGFENDALFVAIHAAPQDLTDEELASDPLKYGRMANPAMGRIVDPDEFLADYASSKKSIQDLLDFKMYRLNIWQQTSNPWLRAGDWQACRKQFTAESMAGRECYAALDLSRVRDMSALVLTFPWPEDGEECYRILPWFWLPSDRADELKLKVPVQAWAAAGHIELTPGGVIDYGFIKARFRQLTQQYRIKELAYDPKFAEELTQSLEQGSTDDKGKEIEKGTGVPRFVFDQSDINFAAPVQDYERLVVGGTLHHNGHPVLDWQIGHAHAVVRPVSRVKRVMKPTRDSHDPRTVDGVVAGVMALARAMQGCEKSVYEHRGLDTVGDERLEARRGGNPEWDNDDDDD